MPNPANSRNMTEAHRQTGSLA